MSEHPQPSGNAKPSETDSKRGKEADVLFGNPPSRKTSPMAAGGVGLCVGVAGFALFFSVEHPAVGTLLGVLLFVAAVTAFKKLPEPWIVGALLLSGGIGLELTGPVTWIIRAREDEARLLKAQSEAAATERQNEELRQRDRRIAAFAPGREEAAPRELADLCRETGVANLAEPQRARCARALVATVKQLVDSGEARAQHELSAYVEYAERAGAGDAVKPFREVVAGRGAASSAESWATSAEASLRAGRDSEAVERAEKAGNEVAKAVASLGEGPELAALKARAARVIQVGIRNVKAREAAERAAHQREVARCARIAREARGFVRSCIDRRCSGQKGVALDLCRDGCVTRASDVVFAGRAEAVDLLLCWSDHQSECSEAMGIGD